jgi:hypothetical protein
LGLAEPVGPVGPAGFGPRGAPLVNAGFGGPEGPLGLAEPVGPVGPAGFGVRGAPLVNGPFGGQPGPLGHNAPLAGPGALPFSPEFLNSGFSEPVPHLAEPLGPGPVDGPHLGRSPLLANSYEPYRPAPYVPYQPAPYHPAPYHPYQPAPYHPAPYEPEPYVPAVVRVNYDRGYGNVGGFGPEAVPVQGPGFGRGFGRQF